MVDGEKRFMNVGRYIQAAVKCARLPFGRVRLFLALCLSRLRLVVDHL